MDSGLGAAFLEYQPNSPLVKIDLQGNICFHVCIFFYLFFARCPDVWSCSCVYFELIVFWLQKISSIISFGDHLYI